MASSKSFFNALYYLKQNPDVAEAVAKGHMTAESHFELYGKFEGRAPNAAFNPAYYLKNNPDVAEAVQNGFITAQEHFDHYGKFEGRQPSALFDPTFYLDMNRDVAAVVQSSNGALTAYDHFMVYGFNEARAINPVINLDKYLKDNPDVATAVKAGQLNAFDHLVHYGMAEGRSLGNGVSLEQFANDPAFKEAIKAGNISEAVAIVTAVSPFFPSFEAPEAWTIPSNLRVPTDFVPVAGDELIIPNGVIVPEGLELPDFIKPNQNTPPQPEKPVEPEIPVEPETPIIPEPEAPVEPTIKHIVLNPDGWTSGSNKVSFTLEFNSELKAAKIYLLGGGASSQQLSTYTQDGLTTMTATMTLANGQKAGSIGIDLLVPHNAQHDAVLTVKNFTINGFTYPDTFTTEDSNTIDFSVNHLAELFALHNTSSLTDSLGDNYLSSASISDAIAHANGPAMYPVELIGVTQESVSVEFL